MIIDKQIWVKLSSSNIRYYKSLGYDIPIGKDKRGRTRVIKENNILVNVIDLPKSSNIKINVQCEDCGKFRKINISTLTNRLNSSYIKNGETLCSKCANKRMSGINNSQYLHGNSHYCEYRYNARKRGYDFDLTIDDFEKLVPSNCFYCGEKSNGIDRWDNTKGYTIDNSLPCCGSCNFIKRTDTPIQFINKITKIYETLKNKHLI